MGLPKEEPVQYDEWQGTAFCKGYHDHQYGRSYIMVIDGDDTFVNLGKQLAGKTLDVNATYTLKISRRKGTKGWYVQKIDPIIDNKEVGNGSKEVGKNSKEVSKNSKIGTENGDKKDKGIKWLTCLKASAVVNAGKPAEFVLSIAQIFYDYNPDKSDPVKNIETDEMF